MYLPVYVFKLLIDHDRPVFRIDLPIFISHSYSSPVGCSYFELNTAISLSMRMLRVYVYKNAVRTVRTLQVVPSFKN